MNPLEFLEGCFPFFNKLAEESRPEISRPKMLGNTLNIEQSFPTTPQPAILTDHYYTPLRSEPTNSNIPATRRKGRVMASGRGPLDDIHPALRSQTDSTRSNTSSTNFTGSTFVGYGSERSSRSESVSSTPPPIPVPRRPPLAVLPLSPTTAAIPLPPPRAVLPPTPSRRPGPRPQQMSSQDPEIRTALIRETTIPGFYDRLWRCEKRPPRKDSGYWSSQDFDSAEKLDNIVKTSEDVQRKMSHTAQIDLKPYKRGQTPQEDVLAQLKRSIREWGYFEPFGEPQWARPLSQPPTLATVPEDEIYGVGNLDDIFYDSGIAGMSDTD